MRDGVQFVLGVCCPHLLMRRVVADILPASSAPLRPTAAVLRVTGKGNARVRPGRWSDAGCYRSLEWFMARLQPPRVSTQVKSRRIRMLQFCVCSLPRLCVVNWDVGHFHKDASLSSIGAKCRQKPNGHHRRPLLAVEGSR